MALPEAFLQELIMRSDISSIAQDYINLKRAGRNMVGLCPFHSEKTPSFNIYTENNSFYCFGCGVGGNVINFVMRIEKLDYIDAVKFLAQRAGMEIPVDVYDPKSSHNKKRIYEANRQAARFFYSRLYSSEGESGLRYLRDRGVTDKIIRHFGLGFAPKTKFALCTYLRNLGFSSEELTEANLGLVSKSGGNVFDRFFNRIIFPIIDVRGNVIAFGGRVMTDEKPKYLNTSNTLVFKKSEALFNLNDAKNTGERKLLLCEGYMDVIAVYQAGFVNAVATLGTALTQIQAQLIKNYADEVTICYDGDEAGKKACLKAIGILRGKGLSVRVLILPFGKDPDEFIRKNGKNAPAAFKNVLQSSINDIEYMLDQLKQNLILEHPDEKIRYLSEAVKVLFSIDSEIEQEVYASKLSEEMGISKETILSQLNRLKRQQGKNYQRGGIRRLFGSYSLKRSNIQRAEKAERSIISFLINNPDKIDYIKSKLTEDMIKTEFNKKLYNYFSERIIQGKNLLLNIAHDFSEEEAGKIAELLACYKSELATKEALEEYINVIIKENKKLMPDVIESATDDQLRELIKSIKPSKS